MNAVKNMNGTIWVFAAILIGLVLVQSFLFYRLAMNFNKKHNLVTEEELQNAKRTGAIAAIGPSMSAIVVALSLIAMVGGATTFMRCGVIGAPGWELLMANIAVSAAGAEFNTESFTEAVFTMVIFCMILGSAPYFINTMVMLKPLDDMLGKAAESKQKVSFMPYLSNSAMFGLLGYSVTERALGGASAIVAMIGSGIGYVVFNKLTKGNKMASSFALAVAMIVGMACGQIAASMGL